MKQKQRQYITISAFRLVIGLSTLVGCATTQVTRPQDVVLEQSMDVDELVDMGVRFGGRIAEQAVELIEKKGASDEAGTLLKKKLVDHSLSWDVQELLAILTVYQKLPKDPHDVVERLLQSEAPPILQLAWQLAEHLPSPQVASTIDRVLSNALFKGEEERHLLPEMAQAVAANKLQPAYTFVRQGLVARGQPEFAESMASLNPKAASDDFMDYLATVPLDELRQIHVVSLPLMTATVIFEHLLEYPPQVSHPKFQHLFLFATSRNAGLSEMAELVLGTYLPANSRHLALMLSRLPVRVQVAYVEKARRSRDGDSRLMLSELKELSAQPDVIEELGDILR